MSYFKFHKLSPVQWDDKQIHRSVCVSSGRPLVLFHKCGNSLCPDVPVDLGQQMKNLGLGPFADLSQNNWDWCRAEPNNFNCHSLAIGSSVGLTPQDWLEGKASPATLNHNPVQLILDTLFVQIENDIRDNDVFVLRDSRSNHLVHSGFVRWIDNRLAGISKFGEGPVLLTRLDLIAKVFHGSFDQIDWYRVAGHAHPEMFPQLGCSA